MFFIIGLLLQSTLMTKITLLGTNDIHGQLFAQPNGGLSLFASYLQKARETYPHLLWLDAGDQYTGTLESNFFNGSSISEALNYLKLDAVASGNHDFDFGHEVTQQRLKQQNYPTLLANLEPQFPNTKPYHIFSVENVDIGVIGLTTLDTPQTSAYHFNQTFMDLQSTVQKYCNQLRDKVQIIVLLMHVGMFCNQDYCHGELDRFLKQNLQDVDVVISGHTHSIVSTQSYGIPVIQSGHAAQFFQMIHLEIENGKILKEKTAIEGPIKVLEGAQFLGETMKENETFVEKFKFYQDQVQKIKSEKVAKVVQEVGRTEGKNEMGLLTCDAMMEHLEADYCLINSGMLRIDFEPGELTYNDIFQVIPFTEKVVSCEFTGSELMEVFKILYESENAIYIQKGFHITIEIKKDIKTLLGATLENGGAIVPDQTYKVVIPDFFLNGGDDFRHVRTWYTPRNQFIGNCLKEGKDIREVLKNYLKQLKIINSKEHPIYNPNHPQFTIIHNDQESIFLA